MILSLTGFGRSQSSFEGVDLTVEVNAVNRRNLEISVSLPREWQALEREVQALLRGLFSRGKLHVSVLAVPAVAEAGFQWDEKGLEASLRRLEEVAYRHRVGWPPTAESLVRLAALNKVDMRLPEPEAIGALVVAEAGKAARALLLMREAEGAALGADLGERIAALSQSMANIGRLSSESVPRYREVLFQRLSQAGLELDPTDERVLKEIALFADKSDISEEQIRLDSHLGQFRECLAEGSPVGRKLEFILQEINREFNTIGSKAGHIEISREVIEAKNEIERIREQLQNIE